jgi:hypothetical protein
MKICSIANKYHSRNNSVSGSKTYEKCLSISTTTIPYIESICHSRKQYYYVASIISSKTKRGEISSRYIYDYSS